jgi:biopolymer transport protein ExbD/biopolymer transport protein TolR
MAWLPSTSSSKRDRPRPIMNVTPLVDVVLVLLIIFMVVIPAMDQAVEIQVPGIVNVDEKADEKAKPFILSVTDKGEAYLEDEAIPAAQLEARLRAATRREPQRKLVLKGDVGLAYGHARRIYRVVQQVGFPGVSLRVNHRKTGTQTAAR